MDTELPVTPSDYASWTGIVNRRFTGRHLGPLPPETKLPPVEDVVALYARPKDDFLPSERSSILFAFFAQWFTDSFLRTHPYDHRQTTSNHEIELCQIYGLDEASTRVLREGEGGRLLHRTKKGQVFPPLLFKGEEIDIAFYDWKRGEEVGLTYMRAGRAIDWQGAIEGSLRGATTDPNRRDFFYASGLDRGGSTIVYSAFNTIFLCEHNRIASVLADANKEWSDDRLFETARLINIRQLLGVVIEDYIGHIADLPLKFDPTFGRRGRWHRSNRISIEFDLLYRWHSMVPEALELAGRTLLHQDYRFNNALLEQHGVRAVIDAASRQKAGKFALGNTPDFLMHAETRALKWAREFRLQGFNAYRKAYGLRPYTSFDEMTGDAKRAEALKALYDGDIDAVEFTVGLVAEARPPTGLMGKTLLCIVAHDAFTHIYTNPVLAPAISCPEVFSPAGWEIVQARSTLAEIIARNTVGEGAGAISLAC